MVCNRGCDGHYAGVECADAETELQHRTFNMKIEMFEGHQEAKEALALSVAAVTAIILIESLLLLVLY